MKGSFRKNGVDRGSYEVYVTIIGRDFQVCLVNPVTVYTRICRNYPPDPVTATRQSRPTPLAQKVFPMGRDGNGPLHSHKTCLLYAVKVQRSLAPLSWFPGSRKPAHVHQCCRFQSYAKSRRLHAIANDIYKRNLHCVNHIPGIHDNGPHGPRCDVCL